MSGGAFEDYLTRWREAGPQRAVAWMFLHQDEQIRYGALAALEHEWLKVLREVREPQVATARLGWWREELQRATHGQARHPLTQALFADTRAGAVPLASWLAPVDAAIVALTAAAPADFAAQCAAAAPLAGAVADLEACVWFGIGTDSRRAARVTLFAHLASRVRALTVEVEHGRSPLPMNLLARHGLTVEESGRDSPSRRAALRDYAEALERDLSVAAKMPGPLTLFRTMGLRHDLGTLDRAVRVDDPLPALCAPAHGLRNVLKTWRAARNWRRMTQTEPDP